ncbi:hypothetical protein [Citrobacter pasteurii]|nr:hypothetical protein SF123566_0709 [Shigella flexneri 1235-66]CEJ66185.1 hypothetical protein [Citrobacter pasteurii]
MTFNTAVDIVENPCGQPKHTGCKTMSLQRDGSGKSIK